MKIYCLAALLLPVFALAQNPSAAAPKVNLIQNGDFGQFTPEDNVWDGVDGEGFLSGDATQETRTYKKGVNKPQGPFFQRRTGYCDAVLEGGNVGHLAMPISVQVADLNKDGLLDILTLDGAGYFRVYFNSGTPTEPKFTHCEMVPLYLSRVSASGEIPGEGGFKVCLGDFDKSGTWDLVMGTYLGRILLIKNTGTAAMPEWKQPQNIASITIPTSRDGRLWANLLAPVVADWNNDGKPDIIVGEGSYSANAVHLLLNNSGSFGAKESPLFSTDGREYLAYGDGREQLVPAVVDYNGNGSLDLLVGDRLGNIWVYLSDGPWKKGAELKRQENPISFGGVTAVGASSKGTGCVFPTIADLNGDGKFDNIGTATEPKFGPLVEIKGEDVFKPGSIREPMTWEANFGYLQGNIYGYYSVVTPEEDPDAAPTTSKQVLKFGYDPSLNKVIRKPQLLLSGSMKALPKADVAISGTRPLHWGTAMGEAGGIRWDSNAAILRQEIEAGALKPNTNYMLSFKVKGRGVKSGHAAFVLGGWLIRELAKASKSSATLPSSTSECVQQEFNFDVTPTWATVTKTLNFKFQKEKDLNDPAKWGGADSKVEYQGLLDIRAAVNIDDGVFYIDDVRLTPM